jgi:hypothetical protein
LRHAALTTALGVWLFPMPVNWSGAWVVVALHLLLTLVSGAMLIAQDSREAAKFRAL